MDTRLVAQLYQSFATGSQQIHLLRANSHSPDTAGQVQKRLAGRAIAPRPDEPRIEVWKFWRELKQRVPEAREWLDKSPNGRCIGIGLLPAQT